MIQRIIYQYIKEIIRNGFVLYAKFYIKVLFFFLYKKKKLEKKFDNFI